MVPKRSSRAPLTSRRAEPSSPSLCDFDEPAQAGPRNCTARRCSPRDGRGTPVRPSKPRCCVHPTPCRCGVSRAPRSGNTPRRGRSREPRRGLVGPGRNVAEGSRNLLGKSPAVTDPMAPRMPCPDIAARASRGRVRAQCGRGRPRARCGRGRVGTQCGRGRPRTRCGRGRVGTRCGRGRPRTSGDG